ncbi:hypothetical protein B0H16DRAFT_1711520 [Mycena metata]|uniref:Protein kinase domain-containing protein n=1 Tax=Mycena metata TaxID=1033252 RepID=A0AAD7K680_9AGAR|nr:hypothetical protein B0H16DRAFT_1711520 [Mycena metata]
MPAAHQVYSSQLSQLHQGYALWGPEPCHYKEVTPGDVGYLKDGSFHRLFNATLSADHEDQTLGVPPCFQPLELPPAWLYRNDKFFNPGNLRSSSVTECRYGIDVNGTILPGGAGVYFSCSTKQGALLHLSRPAIREDALAMEAFETCTLQHFQHWYDFANKTLRRGVKTGMMIVTGCDKTFEWASAVFDERSKDAGISLQIDAVPGLSAELTFSGKWDTSSAVQHRSGPIHKGADAPKNDQTIFIRGYKVLQRPMRAPKVIRAAAKPRSRSPSPGRDGDQPDLCAASVSDLGESTEWEWALESIPGDSRVYHPSDALLEYILDHSEDDVAIVHDDDWCGVSTHPALRTGCPLVAEILQRYERSFFDDNTSTPGDEWNPCFVASDTDRNASLLGHAPAPFIPRRPDASDPIHGLPSSPIHKGADEHKIDQTKSFIHSYKDFQTSTRAPKVTRAAAAWPDQDEDQAARGTVSAPGTDKSTKWGWGPRQARGFVSFDDRPDLRYPERFKSAVSARDSHRIADLVSTAAKPLVPVYHARDALTQPKISQGRQEILDNSNKWFVSDTKQPWLSGTVKFINSVLLFDIPTSTATKSRRPLLQADSSSSQGDTTPVRFHPAFIAKLEKVDQKVAGRGLGNMWCPVPGRYKILRALQNPDTAARPKNLFRDIFIRGQLEQMHRTPFGASDLSLGGWPFLTSPSIRHGILTEFLSNERSNINHLSLISNIVCGLEYLHSQDIVHGDANILVTSSSKPLLADFGISSIINAEATNRAGTPRWCAPELFLPEGRTSFGSDVFSFASVSYEILTAFQQKQDDTDPIASDNVIKNHQRLLEAHDDIPLPDSLWRLLGDCWDGTAENRPTAHQIVERLRRPLIQARTSSSLSDWDHPALAELPKAPLLSLVEYGSSKLEEVSEEDTPSRLARPETGTVDSIPL